MLRDASAKIEHETQSWASTGPRGASVSRSADWQVVDRELRKIASRRAALDADEARWLREAERCQIWRELGMVSALDYLERVLGYAPRTGQERLRVARALGELPGLTAALERGQLAYSAIRELTRVTTPATEQAWCDAALGKNLRQIEELVADHKPGDRPDDPRDPEARVHVVRIELSAATFALWRQTRQVLDGEHGVSLSDDAMVAAMCGTVLDASEVSDAREPNGRAKYQIAMVVCERCRKGWQEGAGVKVAVDGAMIGRAMCDAQYVGRVDGDAVGRAHQDVAPSVARYVWRRDGGRCRVPGCRSSRGLELHHVVHRAQGGTHEAVNLVLLCSACHAAHHQGKLRIGGTAERLDVARYAERERAQVGAVQGAEGRAQVGAVQRAESGAHVGAVQRAESRAHVGAVQSAERRAQEDAVQSAEGRAHVDTARDARQGSDGVVARAIMRVHAKEALTGMGWKPAVAVRAVDSAMAVMANDAPLDRVIFEALRRCGRPVGG